MEGSLLSLPILFPWGPWGISREMSYGSLQPSKAVVLRLLDSRHPSIFSKAVQKHAAI